jgi:hypothetical protein
MAEFLDDDIALKSMPAEGPLTPLKLFVCTFVSKIDGLTINFEDLARLICGNLRPNLLAVNSNFGYSCQLGYDTLLTISKKDKKKKEQQSKKKERLVRGRPRKSQGNGTYFHSAIESIFRIEHPGIPIDKVYKIKCFPSSGQTQIPGVICEDFSDGILALHTFVDYLNDILPSETGTPNISIISYEPNMINFKFCINCKSPRNIINSNMLVRYFYNIQLRQDAETLEQALADPNNEKWKIIMPPFPIRETKPPIDDTKISFIFQCKGNKGPRINIFGGGKINILGASSKELARTIYDYCSEIFIANWETFIMLKPMKDSERKAMLAARAAAAAAASEAAATATPEAVTPVTV